MKRKTNGKHRRRKKKVHRRTTEAHERVLKAAQRQGVISNELACVIGGFNQGWYHLNLMAKAGKLKRTGFNQWVPAKQ